MTISVINGPNLNLLGKREPQIYGSETLDNTLDSLQAAMPDVSFRRFQSNCEGEIIDRLHLDGFDPEVDGIIINPGAYAHYSYAIADAIAALPIPVIEVHISNIHAREEFRHKSVTAPSCRAVICGCGRTGYRLAAEYIKSIVNG